jgi:hypothetical protein
MTAGKSIDDCIFDINGIRLVSYFGSSSKRIMNRNIEIIGLNCFSDVTFTELRFEPGSNLSRILDWAFVPVRFFI